MKYALLTVFAIIFFSLYTPVSAYYSPLSQPNNTFGIHIIDESDLESAAKLVNSNGGEWGYVTLVIAQNDRDNKKWQRIFDRMRELKLIPIVRIATIPQKSIWEIPKIEEANNWAAFLNGLNWVVENRYVILFNEPNHDKEWGGKSSAKEYVEIVKTYSKALKDGSNDFVIMPAGFDLGANNTATTTDAENYFRQMYESDNEIFTRFDAWTSHSYPNPGFAGNPSDSGKKSIKGFLWELSFLSSFGLKKDIPVFITETGWIHNGEHDEGKIAEFFKNAFENAWSHPQVVAVTPFILSYSTEPFKSFSWKKSSDPEIFYEQYKVVSEIKKTKGVPKQVNNIKFLESPIPSQLFTDSFYTLNPQFTNSGQRIWAKDDITIKVETSFPKNSVTIGDILDLKPNETASLPIAIKTPGTEGVFDLSLEFFIDGKQFGEKVERQIEIIPPTKLVISTNLGWKINSNTENASIIIYEADRLVKKISQIKVVNGEANIPAIHDVIPGKTYRFVLTNEGYIPKSFVAFLNPTGPTPLSFGRMMPFDFNGDGSLSLKDFFSMLRHPIKSIKLLSLK